MAGWTASFGAGSNDTVLAKYDPSGNIFGCGSACGSPSATLGSPSASVGSPAATVNTPTATVNTPTATVSAPLVGGNFIGTQRGSAVLSVDGDGQIQGGLKVAGDIQSSANLIAGGYLAGAQDSLSGSVLKIGNDAWLCDIDVANTAAIRGAAGCRSVGSGTLRGTFAADSSLRYKQDIAQSSYGLNEILQLNPVTYHYKSDPSGALQLGLIAEDMATIMPEMVQYDELNRPDAIFYDRLGVVLISATKELNTKVDSQDNLLQGQVTTNTNGTTALTASMATAQGQISLLTNQMNSGTFSVVNVSGNTSTQSLTVSGAATVGSLQVVGSATVGSLTVSGMAQFNGGITVNGHVVTGGNAPTVQVQGSAGSGAVVTISGNDTMGTVVIVTGSSPVAGDITKVVFSQAYGAPPRVVMSPSNDKAAGLRYFRGITDVNSFMLNFIDNPVANTTYQYDYFVAQ